MTASFDSSRPFTRAVALANGIAAHELRTKQYRRLFTGVYLDANAPVTAATRAAAALLTTPDPAFASHVTAARVHGTPIPAVPEEHVTVLRRRDRRSRPGIVCHYTPRARVTQVNGVRVSSPAQTFCELAALLPLIDVIVAGDWLVRHRKVSRAAINKTVATRTGAGAERARRAAGYVRARVDSRMETRLRMLLVLAGLPEPEVNLPLEDEDGRVVRRHDLCYPSIKVAIEYDGRHHIERETQWESDLDRREASDDDGWRLLVITSRGIHAEPDRTLSRVHRLLLARRFPGTPSQLSDAWRAHFPRP